MSIILKIQIIAEIGAFEYNMVTNTYFKLAEFCDDTKGKARVHLHAAQFYKNNNKVQQSYW